MSFELSSRNIEIVGGVLYADCLRLKGGYVSSSLQLDPIIGNIDGILKWGYKGFSSSARNVRWESHLLKALLGKLDDRWVEGSLDLNAHITNDDGSLKAVNIPMPSDLPEESEKASTQQLNDTVDVDTEN